MAVWLSLKNLIENQSDSKIIAKIIFMFPQKMIEKTSNILNCYSSN